MKQCTHLSIMAHQDDVEFWSYHGILECFGQSGKSFAAVVVTDGAGSPRTGLYKNYTDEQMKQVRKAEQQKAAEIGGYTEIIQLGYPSVEVKHTNSVQVIDDLYKLLSEMKPETVYTHNLADRHETHVAVALRTVSAIRRLPLNLRPKKVYGCEGWRDLDWLDAADRVSLDVGGNRDLAVSLMNVFDSQISGGKNYAEAVTGRRIANATFTASHAVDTAEQIAFAMDLTPLVKDGNLDVSQFIARHIDKFRADVLEKLKI